MNSFIHAKNSSKRWGGEPEEYLEIHSFIDSSKSALGDIRHRAMLHHAFGIFIVEKIFGSTLKISTGRKVPIREIAENHILEDLGFIPTMEHWFKNMQVQKWMSGTLRGRLSDSDKVKIKIIKPQQTQQPETFDTNTKEKEND